MRTILRIKVHDTQCGSRAFRTKLVQDLNLKATCMPFATEMLAEAKQANAKIVEMPIAYRRRIGETKLNLLNVEAPYVFKPRLTGKSRLKLKERLREASL